MLFIKIDIWILLTIENKSSKFDSREAIYLNRYDDVVINQLNVIKNSYIWNFEMFKLRFFKKYNTLYTIFFTFVFKIQIIIIHKIFNRYQNHQGNVWRKCFLLSLIFSCLRSVSSIIPRNLWDEFDHVHHGLVSIFIKIYLKPHFYILK